MDKLGGWLSSEISKILEIPNRGSKSAKYRVLAKTMMPAILIEFGFIDENHDEILDPAKQDRMLQKVAEIIKEYLG